MAKPFTSIPLLSGATLTGHSAEFQNDKLALFSRVARTERDLSRIRFFGLNVVTVTGPSAVHEALVEKGKAFGKHVGIRILLYPIAGNGLFTSDGDLWRRQRKLMAPLFQPAYLETYAAGMVECIRRWIDGLREGDVIDVGHEMTRLTMNIVARALFDADTDGDARSLGQAVTTVIEYLGRQAGTAGLIAKMTAAGALEKLEGRLPAALEPARSGAFDLLRNPSPLSIPSARRLRSAVETLNAHVERMIQDRRKAGLTRPDFLSKLLAARDEDDGHTMSDQQVRDEVLTLFFAGHETTAVAVTWALFLLSEHPAVAERMRVEIAALRGRAPSVSELPHQPYVLRVVKETLRLYPPAFMFDRVVKEDVEIGGYAIPRGTALFFSPYALHRRADHFPDPERFDPDRFLPEVEERRTRFAYMPFGAGPRVCIGSHFALMEAQLALTLFTQRLRLTPLPGQVVRPGSLATLRPGEPFRMRVERRSNDA
jgi:cytochrome P450